MQPVATETLLEPSHTVPQPTPLQWSQQPINDGFVKSWIVENEELDVSVAVSFYIQAQTVLLLVQQRPATCIGQLVRLKVG
jgi:hypothetical protein